MFGAEGRCNVQGSRVLELGGGSRIFSVAGCWIAEHCGKQVLGVHGVSRMLGVLRATRFQGMHQAAGFWGF